MPELGYTPLLNLLTPGSTSTIIHQILKAPGSDESRGRNVYSRSGFDVATGLMGGARGTTMANVKSAIATGVSSAL